MNPDNVSLWTLIPCNNFAIFPIVPIITTKRELYKTRFALIIFEFGATIANSAFNASFSTLWSLIYRTVSFNSLGSLPLLPSLLIVAFVLFLTETSKLHWTFIGCLNLSTLVRIPISLKFVATAYISLILPTVLAFLHGQTINNNCELVPSYDWRRGDVDPQLIHIQNHDNLDLQVFKSITLSKFSYSDLIHLLALISFSYPSWLIAYKLV